MIATLRGKVTEKIGKRVVLDIGGVGYGVLVTDADFGVLTTDKEVKLYIHEHIKEDLHELFGFRSPETQGLFEQLLSVKNVGPKVGLAILDIGPDDLVRQAIAAGDMKRLQTAKGVGKRAAEQIVVELRDKVGIAVGDNAENLVSRAGIGQGDEALKALISLGYDESDAMIALQDVDKNLSTEDRVKQALKGKN